MKEHLIQALNLTKNESLKKTLFDILDLMQSSNSSLQVQYSIHHPTNYYQPSNSFRNSYSTKEMVLKQGFLWKKGKSLALWSKRYYIISGRGLSFFYSIFYSLFFSLFLFSFFLLLPFLYGVKVTFLSGNCIYYYSNQNDIRPKGVIFLSGSLIERVKDNDLALKGEGDGSVNMFWSSLISNN